MNLQDINIQGEEEAQTLQALTSKVFGRTKCFDAFFLVEIGMLDPFIKAFDYVGWSDFANITEEGSVLLTQEFLLTLRMEKCTTGTFINFCLFNTEFSV